MFLFCSYNFSCVLLGVCASFEELPELVPSSPQTHPKPEKRPFARVVCTRLPGEPRSPGMGLDTVKGGHTPHPLSNSAFNPVHPESLSLLDDMSRRLISLAPDARRRKTENPAFNPMQPEFSARHSSESWNLPCFCPAFRSNRGEGLRDSSFRWNDDEGDNRHFPASLAALKPRP